MASLQGTALLSLKNHILVFHSDSLYIYPETLASSTDDNTPDNDTPTTVDFPLHSLEPLSVIRNLLLCCPAPNTLAVFQFQPHETSGKLLPPSLVGEWFVPSHLRISVACWMSLESSRPTSDLLQHHALLGTRDGTILRLDMQHPGALVSMDINGMPSPMFQQATISAIAAAPCGEGYYAVGYASGRIAIMQEVSSELKTTHVMETSQKVLALSWHYSSKDKATQSLATLRAGSDRLHIYTVSVAKDTTPPRKIRDIPLPKGESIPSICSKFLQWSKSGKVTRVSDSGLVVSDVRTKKVSTCSIPLPPPVIALDVKSSKGKVWVIDSDGVLSSYNLLDGLLLQSAVLPFSLMLESPTILDSPVVFFQRPAQVNAIVYKNKRALKSPTQESTSELSPTLASSTTSKHNPSPNFSRPNRHKPSNSSSSCISTLSPLTAASPQHHHTTPIVNSSPIVHLATTPDKATMHSLFTTVTKALSEMPHQQNVPEYIPALSTSDQYAISAIFGGVYSTALCLGGILDILQNSISQYPESFKSLIFSLFLSDISLTQLIATLSKLPDEKHYSDRFVFTLLSIASIAGGPRDSPVSSIASTGVGVSTHPRYNLELVSLVQEMLNAQDDLPSDDIHLICSYMVSLGYHLEARQIYLNSYFFLEAFVVSLIGKLEFLSVLHQWCLFLRANSQNPNLVNYLSEVCTKLTTRHSSTSTNNSSLDDLQMTAETLSNQYANAMRISDSAVSEDITIFSPELISNEYTTAGPDEHAAKSGISHNRIMILSTPKSSIPHAQAFSPSSSSSSPDTLQSFTPVIHATRHY